ncbi:TPA: hypothetical protein N0F65_004792 [Lagenidium giganteum]|uniref:Uncharacterized protein n=1 Tax=Lagenidium giganteum TaxID=4803 RepID=A0AAV2Z9R8_9STRA|nr:TPA: hypothetical protein N0F65_004792 [Lagenidium giganteum]
MALSKPMEMLAAATAAGVGGFMATSILYPLDTLKTRMQSTTKDAAKDDEDEVAPASTMSVVRSLYRGIQYKTAESTTSKFFYFYAYTLLSGLAARGGDVRELSTATNLLVGYLSEFVHLPVTLPMEVVATRLQTSKDGAGGSIMQIIRRVHEESGLAGFYKGFQAYFVLCMQPAIQYTVFERVKEIYLRRFKRASDALGALEAFLLGAIARSIATLLLFPYIRAKVLLQAKKKKQVASDPEAQKSAPDTCSAAKQSDGITATIQRVYRDEGFLALYRGLCPELTRGALSSAIMLMIKEKIQTYITLLLIVANSM